MPPPAAAPQLIDRALDGLTPEMIAFRRDIHAHPELSWHEARTTAAVSDHLRRVGLVASTLPGGTGLFCDVPSGGGEPRLALRADLDALPIADETPTPYRSCVPGVAHACGHDVHAAVVLGAGLGLARLAATGDLPGPVRLLFQPAEEVIPGGAISMLEAGLLDGVERVFALHCDPAIDAGTVGVREGPITGATDIITVRLSGPGGHTARPQLTVDLVAALADVVVRDSRPPLQTG